MRKYKNFDDYKDDIIERGNLINKGLNGMLPTEAIPLICTSIDFYCASMSFDNNSTAKFYQHIADLGRLMNR